MLEVESRVGAGRKREEKQLTWKGGEDRYFSGTYYEPVPPRERYVCTHTVRDKERPLRSLESSLQCESNRQKLKASGTSISYYEVLSYLNNLEYRTG